jgi:hypothetical protein
MDSRLYARAGCVRSDVGQTREVAALNGSASCVPWRGISVRLRSGDPVCSARDDDRDRYGDIGDTAADSAVDAHRELRPSSPHPDSRGSAAPNSPACKTHLHRV